MVFFQRGDVTRFLNELIKYEQVLKFSEKPLTLHFAKHNVERWIAVRQDGEGFFKQNLTLSRLRESTQLAFRASLSTDSRISEGEPLKLDLFTNCLLVQNPWCNRVDGVTKVRKCGILYKQKIKFWRRTKAFRQKKGIYE